jgi:AcrR family transcriptional regulator
MQQSDARERERRSLLVAGEAVIGQRGFARTTVEDVAVRANLDPPVFYSHFQGMGALLRALSANFVEQTTNAIDQATRSGIWKGAPARDLIEIAVRSTMDVVIDRQGLVRALLAHGTTDNALSADLRKIGTHLANRLVTAINECTNRPARPGRSIAFSLLASAAIAHHYILVGDEWSGISFNKEQLIDETATAICAYLGLQPTIAIMEDSSPDLARTDMIEALKTDEIEAVKPNGD